MIISICLFWIVCGVFAFGLTFAYFQRKYPSTAEERYRVDLCFALALAIFGPLGLSCALVNGGYEYRLKFK